MPEHIISIEPEESLYDAVRLLVTQRIHRLPVIHKVRACSRDETGAADA